MMQVYQRGGPNRGLTADVVRPTPEVEPRDIQRGHRHRSAPWCVAHLLPSRIVTTSSDDLAQRVREIEWYHRMPLPGGIVTPGITDVATQLPRLHLPQSLEGKTVLDVGSWDGFYAFECARRGAKRVLATDSFSWDGSNWGTKEGFLLAREALGLDGRVDDRMIDVMDLGPEELGDTFDVVLVLGLLYHLTNPIVALERVSRCCRELMVIETDTALNWLPWPAARVNPGRELRDDPTNWYQYNLRALRGLLERVGFGSVELKFRTSLPRRVARAALGVRHGESFRPTLRSCRTVIHAHRTGTWSGPAN